MLRVEESRVDQIERRVANEKARLCVLIGLQPSEYDGLTDLEREAFVELANKLQTQQRR